VDHTRHRKCVQVSLIKIWHYARVDGEALSVSVKLIQYAVAVEQVGGTAGRWVWNLDRP